MCYRKFFILCMYGVFSSVTAFETNHAFVIGQGFDARTQKIKQNCLEGRKIIHGKLQLVDSVMKPLLSSYDEILSVETKDFLNSFWKLSFVKKFSSSSTEASFVFPVEFRGIDEEILHPREKRKIKQLKNRGFSTQDLCGDHFISKITWGMEYLIGIKFIFENEEDKRRFSIRAHFDQVLLGKVMDFALYAQERTQIPFLVRMDLVYRGGRTSFLRRKNVSKLLFHCNNGRFTHCQDFIQQFQNFLYALRYHSSWSEGVLDRTGLGVLSYSITPYSKVEQ